MNWIMKDFIRVGVIAGAMFSGVSLMSAEPQGIEGRVTELERKLDVALEMLAEAPSESEATATHIGGYGEMHYNNLTGKGGAGDKTDLDFHRFVLFLDHEFNDRMRFVSELEVEHSLSGDGKPGEVELEQAYVDFDLNENHTARAGLFLLPIGIINATHEPPTFYGVERNSVEKNIIPTTWWEGGLGAHGSLADGLTYGAYLHSGLNTSTNSKYAVRSGRQKVAKANASDLAATLAVSWSKAGVTIGGSVNYQSDLTQGSDSDAGSAVLGELHADLKKGPIGLRALYGQWDLDGTGPAAMDSDKQYGWYIEPSFRINRQVGVFARVSEWDNQAGGSGTASEKTQVDAGVNWWPHDQVVVKADYQWQDNENGKEQNGFNLGLGYNF